MEKFPLKTYSSIKKVSPTNNPPCLFFLLKNIVMKKLIPAILIIALLGSLKANAQRNYDSLRMDGWMKKQFAGTVQLQVTYRKANLGSLNNALNADGIPSLGTNAIWINASMNHVWGQWITEDGIGFTPITTAQANNVKAEYNQYQVYGRLGYNLLSEKDMRLFPFVGVNFSAAVLDIQDRARIDNTSDFATEILNSTSSKTLYQPNFGIELGVGYDYLIQAKPKNMGCVLVQRSVPLGVRAGYYINAYQGDWKVDNQSLTGGGDKKGAVFFSVNIGLGYEIVKK
jgi:hypothetical protein